MPSPEPPAAAYLDFSRDVLMSTTLYSRNTNEPVYEISSKTGLSTTYVHRSSAPKSDPPLAVLAHGALVLPDKVTLRGRPQVKVKAWLKPDGMFSTIPAKMEENGVVYTWKMNDVGLLSLWSGEEQIAWHHPAARQIVDGKSVPMPSYIALQDAAVPMQDVVVIACIVLAQKLRWAEGSGYLSTAATGNVFSTADTFNAFEHTDEEDVQDIKRA
ncbi:hypothetical protein C8R44DRAFT_874582 [Mycena epipterygia]|nr:hypothetical protein C8R44DRAFT_874582 [Mycena epipterygia]